MVAALGRVRKVKAITPFAHVLFGFNHAKVKPSLIIDGGDYTNEFANETGIGEASDMGFGFAAGGGIDFNVCKSVAIRPIQFDYLMSSHEDSFKMHNIKLSFGVVIRLGGK